MVLVNLVTLVRLKRRPPLQALGLLPGQRGRGVLLCTCQQANAPQRGIRRPQLRSARLPGPSAAHCGARAASPTASEKRAYLVAGSGSDRGRRRASGRCRRWSFWWCGVAEFLLLQSRAALPDLSETPGFASSARAGSCVSAAEHARDADTTHHTGLWTRHWRASPPSVACRGTCAARPAELHQAHRRARGGLQGRRRDAGLAHAGAPGARQRSMEGAASVSCALHACAACALQRMVETANVFYSQVLNKGDAKAVELVVVRARASPACLEANDQDPGLLPRSSPPCVRNPALALPRRMRA